MERGDFGLILYAAVTRSFDFTDVGPGYYLRLDLVLRELRKLTNGLVAAQSALHCAIGASYGDDKSRKENYQRLQHNRGIYIRSLELKDEESSSDDYDGAERLIKYWKEHYGNKQHES